VTSEHNIGYAAFRLDPPIAHQSTRARFLTPTPNVVGGTSCVGGNSLAGNGHGTTWQASRGEGPTGAGVFRCSPGCPLYSFASSTRTSRERGFFIALLLPSICVPSPGTAVTGYCPSVLQLSPAACPPSYPPTATRPHNNMRSTSDLQFVAQESLTAVGRRNETTTSDQLPGVRTMSCDVHGRSRDFDGSRGTAPPTCRRCRLHFLRLKSSFGSPSPLPTSAHTICGPRRISTTSTCRAVAMQRCSRYEHGLRRTGRVWLAGGGGGGPYCLASGPLLGYLSLPTSSIRCWRGDLASTLLPRTVRRRPNHCSRRLLRLPRLRAAF